MRRLFSLPSWVGLGVALFAFVVYVRTLSRSVGFIDSGELAAVACTLGIAHPTGYPLFTLLGWIFSRLPIAGEEIVRLNLMAALLSAVGIYFFFRLMHLILGIIPGSEGRNKPETLRFLAAAGASLQLAFSETYWSAATAVEVYSLHSAMIPLLLYAFFLAVRGVYRDGEHQAGPGEHRWLLFAFIVGLSFANHMTTILLAPGLLLYYILLHRGEAGWFRRLIVMVIPFLLGLSAYLYLPLRAAQDPILSWGDPGTFERLLWHLSGKQYQVWIFSSTEAAGRLFRYFVTSLAGEFAIVGFVLALPGLVFLIMRDRRLALITGVLFATCVLYSINYDIHDIDSYFLLAYVVVGLWSCFGLAALGHWFIGRLRLHGVIAVVAVLLFSMVPLVANFEERDEGENFLVEDYTRNMFASLDSGAVVLSYQWDFWVSASYYYQFVKNVRPDVVVIDKELLRRSWYLKEIGHRYPWLIESSRREVDAFASELYKFEHDLSYDGSTIDARFVGMIRSFVDHSMVDRPVYVTAEIEPEFTEGLERVPQGLAFRLQRDARFSPTERPIFYYRPISRTGRLEDMVKRFYADALAVRAGYYYTRGGEPVEAKECLTEAMRFDPGSNALRFWLQRVGR